MKAERRGAQRLLIVLSMVLALVAASCSSDSGSSTTTAQEADPTATTAPDDSDDGGDAEPEPTATTAPEPEPTATPEPEPTATPEPVRGEINESFVGSPLAPYAPTAMLDGEVRVYWNNGTRGNIVAIYHGDGLADLTGLCPGNSLQTSDGAFSHVSNTPAAPGACDGFPTPPSFLLTCTGNVVLYETQIPNDSDGVLWGSLEWNSDAGIVGYTSQASNTPGTPMIDMDARVFSISAMFTTDGSTEITCSEVA